MRLPAKHYGEKHYGNILIKASDNLSSLEGMPKILQGSFMINQFSTTSLEHSPTIVSGNFHCEKLNIESLEGSPRIVGGSFFCRGLKKSVTSLKGLPDSVGGWVICDKRFEKGENLYLIINAEINGRLNAATIEFFEEDVMNKLISYFAVDKPVYE